MGFAIRVCLEFRNSSCRQPSTTLAILDHPRSRCHWRHRVNVGLEVRGLVELQDENMMLSKDFREQYRRSVGAGFALHDIPDW